MIVLGVLLILVAGASAAFAVVASANSAQLVSLEGLGLSFTATPLATFLAGAVSVIFLSLGFALVNRGARRTMDKRKELKQLRKENASATAGAEASGAGGNAGERTSSGERTGTGESTDGGQHTGVHRGTDAPPERRPDAE